jgi:hypothetical protein
MSAGADQSRQPWLLEVVLGHAPWLAPLLIALAPVVGFGARWGALYFAGAFGSSLQITAAESFSVHAATGGLYMTLAVAFFATLMLGDRYIPESPRFRQPWFRALSVAALVTLLVFLPAGLLLGPVLLILLVSGLRLRATHRPSIPSPRDLLPIALVFSVVTTICFAAIGSVPGVSVAQFDFGPKAQTADGRYIELARSGDVLFLYPCEATHLGALVVPADSIVKQTYEKESLVSTAPSLYAMVVWIRPFRVGLSHTCPPPP